MKPPTKIQRLAEELANMCLDETEYNPKYTERDMFNATEIFSHLLSNEIFRKNIAKLPPDKLEDLAITTGKAIHELVISTTDIDLKKVL
jgi:hypothetical protein